MNDVLKEQQLNALLQGIDIPPAPRILIDLQRELGVATGCGACGDCARDVFRRSRGAELSSTAMIR